MRFLRQIISRGLWSVSMINVLPIQVCVEHLTAIYDGQEFPLNVGIPSLCVHQGFAGESYGVPVLDNAGSQPLE